MKPRTGTLYRRGNVWWLKYQVDGRRIDQSLQTASKKEADERRKEIMRPYTLAIIEDAAAVAARRLADATTAREDAMPGMSLASVFPEYRRAPERPDAGPSTLEQYEIQWNKFCLWLAGHAPAIKTINSVTAEHAREFAAWLAGRVSAGTFNKYVSFFNLLWRTLEKPVGLKVNPWLDIKHKSATPVHRQDLSLSELRAVCAAATGDVRQLLGLGLYTGLRLKDCCTLKWSEVDLERNLIRRVPAKTARRKPDPVKIPLHRELRALLEEIPPNARGEYVLPRMATDYMRHSTYVTDRVQKLFEQAGIQTKMQLPGRTKAASIRGFHSLRSSFVSLCRAAGVALQTVESLVGHSNVQMTQLYSHASEHDAKAAVEALPGILNDDETKALPPTREPVPGWVRDFLRVMAGKLTPKTAGSTKAQLLALANS